MRAAAVRPVSSCPRPTRPSPARAPAARARLQRPADSGRDHRRPTLWQWDRRIWRGDWRVLGYVHSVRDSHRHRIATSRGWCADDVRADGPHPVEDNVRRTRTPLRRNCSLVIGATAPPRSPGRPLLRARDRESPSGCAGEACWRGKVYGRRSTSAEARGKARVGKLGSRFCRLGLTEMTSLGQWTRPGTRSLALTARLRSTARWRTVCSDAPFRACAAVQPPRFRAPSASLEPHMGCILTRIRARRWNHACDARPRDPRLSRGR